MRYLWTVGLTLDNGHDVNDTGSGCSDNLGYVLDCARHCAKYAPRNVVTYFVHCGKTGERCEVPVEGRSLDQVWDEAQSRRALA